MVFTHLIIRSYYKTIELMWLIQCSQFLLVFHPIQISTELSTVNALNTNRFHKTLNWIGVDSWLIPISHKWVAQHSWDCMLLMCINSGNHFLLLVLHPWACITGQYIDEEHIQTKVYYMSSGCCASTWLQQCCMTIIATIWDMQILGQEMQPNLDRVSMFIVPNVISTYDIPVSLLH